MSKPFLTEASAAGPGQRDGRKAVAGGLATADSSLVTGREALRRGEWETAREHLERFIADVVGDAPEAWEGLGTGRG